MGVMATMKACLMGSNRTCPPKKDTSQLLFGIVKEKIGTLANKIQYIRTGKTGSSRREGGSDVASDSGRSSGQSLPALPMHRSCPSRTGQSGTNPIRALGSMRRGPMKPFGVCDRSGRVQKFSERTPSPKAPPGRGPRLS